MPFCVSQGCFGSPRAVLGPSGLLKFRNCFGSKKNQRFSMGCHTPSLSPPSGHHLERSPRLFVASQGSLRLHPPPDTACNTQAIPGCRWGAAPTPSSTPFLRTPRQRWGTLKRLSSGAQLLAQRVARTLFDGWRARPLRFIRGAPALNESASTSLADASALTWQRPTHRTERAMNRLFIYGLRSGKLAPPWRNATMELPLNRLTPTVAWKPAWGP